MSFTGQEYDMMQMAAHRVNNLVRKANGQDDVPEPIGSSSYIERIIDGVEEGVQFSPEASWKSWKANRIKDGWVHGEKYDREAKVHPNIVKKYTDLPEEERVKDWTHYASVRCFAEGYVTGLSRLAEMFAPHGKKLSLKRSITVKKK